MVEKADVENVQALVDIILKSDPSAQETRKSSGRRDAAGAKRGRNAGNDSDSDGDEGMDDGADRQQPGAAAAAAAAPEDGVQAMDADDEMISEDEAAAPAGAAASSPLAAGEAIRQAVDEVLQRSGGAVCSVTGVKAVLAAKGVTVSAAAIHEGEHQATVIVDGCAALTTWRLAIRACACSTHGSSMGA